MSTLGSVLAFAGGVIGTAVVREVAARVFGAPRIDAAIADVSLARTKHRSHRGIPVPDKLRLLLSEGPTSHVNWDATFMCEYDIDLSIFELIENEHRCTEEKSELQRYKEVLNAGNVKDQVLTLGRNMSLLQTCVNALVLLRDDAPKIPAEDEQCEEIFPLQYVQGTRDGRTLVFVHLDLPGNPFPVVGSPRGDAVRNEKSASLAYALSHCDHQVLKEILDLAARYCDVRLAESKKLREEFERIKRERSYLEVQILVSNRGKAPAYLSTFADVSVGSAKESLHVTAVDDAPLVNAGAPRWDVIARDTARRIGDRIPDLKTELREYLSGNQNLAIEPSRTVTLHFVSDAPVSSQVMDAVKAMRTGYTDCSLSIWQYTPRKLAWLPWKARFVKRIKTRQKMTRVRG